MIRLWTIAIALSGALLAGCNRPGTPQEACSSEETYAAVGDLMRTRGSQLMQRLQLYSPPDVDALKQIAETERFRSRISFKLPRVTSADQETGVTECTALMRVRIPASYDNMTFGGPVIINEQGPGFVDAEIKYSVQATADTGELVYTVENAASLGQLVFSTALRELQEARPRNDPPPPAPLQGYGNSSSEEVDQAQFRRDGATGAPADEVPHREEFSSSERTLIAEADQLESLCRGGSGPDAENACDRRGAATDRLISAGICWGRHGEAYADYQYHRCQADSIR